MAVFLAHWDNKSENQRLVCLSEDGLAGWKVPEAVRDASGRRLLVRTAEGRSQNVGTERDLGEPRALHGQHGELSRRRRDVRARDDHRGRPPPAGLSSSVNSPIGSWPISSPAARFDKLKAIHPVPPGQRRGLGSRLQVKSQSDQRRAGVSAVAAGTRAGRFRAAQRAGVDRLSPPVDGLKEHRRRPTLPPA